MSNPTDEQWRDLFSAFEDYCIVAPWRWMSDSDVMAVEHPSSREVGYCIVLGNAGYEFGLGLYTGDAGLAAYLAIMTDEVDPESKDALGRASAISATLGTRENLHAADRAVLRRMGIRPNKNDVYPLFRSVKPGLVPWYVDADEADFMTLALANVLDVALRIAEGRLDMHAHGEPGTLLTRMFREGAWRDDWHLLIPPALAPVPDYPYVDRLARLALQLPKVDQTWELSTLFLPTPIAEKKETRPYLPMGVLIVDNNSTFMLGLKVLGHAPTAAERQEVLVDAVEEHGILPSALLVDSTRTARLFESVTGTLGIDLSVGVTSALQDAKDALLREFE